MIVRVKTIELSFNTHTPQPIFRVYDADRFEIIYTPDKASAHLEIYKDDKMIAFYPYQNYMGAELKED